ncbi:MAG: DNA (cytosine-5)-methyltransferase 1 [Arenicella sp.]|jgi:DNA (cytosine-5)-methyltransferase 1
MTKALEIKNKRLGMGLTQLEFAKLLDLKENGERTIRSWENGEHTPTPAKFQQVQKLPNSAPFKLKKNSKTKFDFIDLFSGIGGIRLPFQEQKGRCVFSSEWDKFAQKTYAANYGELPHGDITKITAQEIPSHDLLLAGFPCQAFSQAGLKKGFNDTRGTLFFDIHRILAAHRPKAFLLENVKQLRGHDKGNTLKTILNVLRGDITPELDNNMPVSEEARKTLSEKLNYAVDFRVLRAADFGVPQNRERVYIVGFSKDHFGEVDFDDLFTWPEPSLEITRLGNILDTSKSIQEKYTISEKLWTGHKRRKKEHKAKGNGFGYSLFNSESEYTSTLSARYYKDGSEILIDQSDIGLRPRKLTPRECARLQGFPEKFIVDAVSNGQIYKQFGNSVCVKVISELAKEISKKL